MRKVLILGKIYTMDPFNPQVQNVYVEDGVIREVDMEGSGT